MSKILERCYLQAKNMKWMFFIPLIVYYILIPLMAYTYTLGPRTPEDINATLVDVSYLYVPVFSVWWLYLSLKEYLEGEGNELLVMSGGIGAMSAVFFCATVVSYLPVFLFYDNSMNEITDLFLQMAVASFLMYGVVLAAAFMFRSVAVTMLITLCYAILGTSSVEEFSFIEYGHMQWSVMWFHEALPLVVLGIVFWIYGIRCSKWYRS